MTRTTDEWVAHLKQFCSILEAARITRVEGDYDGSGDSGDMSIWFFQERLPPPPTGTNQPAQISIDRLNEAAGKRLLIEGERPLVTKEAYDEFLNGMWHMLPGGWEINDGSYGEVTLDVETRKITVEHNERYTDVNSSTHTY